MEKKSIFVMVFLIVLMVLTTCNNKNGLNVQYVRTDEIQIVERLKNPIITVISSTNELEQYYEKNKDFYNLSTPPDIVSDSTIVFADAIKIYSNEFFENNYLAIVLLEEGSGSIRHKVERIDDNGDIIIDRLLPELRTADIAKWHIIIELKNNFKPEQFKIILEN